MGALGLARAARIRQRQLNRANDAFWTELARDAGFGQPMLDHVAAKARSRGRVDARAAFLRPHGPDTSARRALEQFPAHRDLPCRPAQGAVFGSIGRKLVYEQPECHCSFSRQLYRRTLQMHPRRGLRQMRRELLADDGTELRAVPVGADEKVVRLCDGLQTRVDGLLNLRT